MFPGECPVRHQCIGRKPYLVGQFVAFVRPVPALVTVHETGKLVPDETLAGAVTADT